MTPCQSVLVERLQVYPVAPPFLAILQGSYLAAGPPNHLSEPVTETEVQVNKFNELQVKFQIWKQL